MDINKHSRQRIMKIKNIIKFLILFSIFFAGLMITLRLMKPAPKDTSYYYTIDYENETE